MHDTRWKQLFVQGGRQEQVVSVEQAVEHGIPRTTFYDTAQRLGMADLGGGVWAQCGAPNTYRRKLWAAKLRLGDDVVFTGRTALWLRRIVSATPAGVDLLVGKRALRSTAKRRCIRGELSERDIVVKIEGFQTAGVYRAFVDVAPVVPLETLLRWLPAMDRLRLGTVDGLAEYLIEAQRRRGIVNLRAAIATLQSDLPHSGDERFARKLLKAADLAPYPRPYPLKVEGAIIAEIDLAYPKILYGVEIDGPHHRLVEVARADKARDRLVARQSWRIDRFTVEEVRADPKGFVEEVRQAVKVSNDRILGHPTP